MKKLTFILILTISIFLSANIGPVKAAQEVGDIDFSIIASSKYDLLTGAVSDDINYTRTNRIEIGGEWLNREITVSSEDFHHVLFFDRNNIYIGYINTATADIELSSYLGYDVEDNQFIAPDRAYKYALMSYNYGVTLNQTAYTYPSIDDIAWESLTYRDIFEGTQLLTDSVSTFAGTYNDSEVVPITYDVGTNTHTITFDATHLVPESTHYIRHYLPSDLRVSGHEFYISYQVKIDTNIYVTVNPFQVGLYNPDLYYDNVNYVYPYDPYTNYVDYKHIQHYYTVLDNTTSGFVNFNLHDSTPTAADSTYSYEVGEYSIVNIKDYMVYDMTAIGFVSNPTPDDFEEMRLYYERYKDVSGDTLSYSQIYGDNSQYGGSNNLIENGDFTDTTDDLDNSTYGWYRDPDYNTYNVYNTIENGYFYHDTVDIVRDLYLIQPIDDILANDIVYFSTDYRVSTDYGLDYLGFRFYDTSFGYGTVTYFNLVNDTIMDNEWHTYSKASILSLEESADVFGMWDFVTLNELYLDNVRLYNWGSIFGPTADDIPIEDFESWYEVWDDPLLEGYNDYEVYGAMSILSMTYLWDNTPAPEPDQTNWLTGWVDDLGFGEGLLVLLSIFIMGGFAFFIMKITDSMAILILGEVSIFLVLALIGWVSMWIVTMIALILVLIILWRIIKGG